MLGACHLFIGVLIGLVLYNYLGDRRVIIFAALGALLPDLLDKPLGHLLLRETVDFGRIYCHTLLFCLAFVVLGIVMLQWRRSFAVLVLSMGIVSHLLLDSMWTLPVTLFYPFLGDFGQHYSPNYFEISFFNEILSPFEWLFLILSVWIILRVYRSAAARPFSALTLLLDRSAIGFTVILGAVAILYASLALAGIISVYSLESAMTLSLIAVAGSIILAWMIKIDYAGTFQMDVEKTATS